MDKPNTDGPVRIEIVDRRQRGEADSEALVEMQAGAGREAAGAEFSAAVTDPPEQSGATTGGADHSGSFSETTPQEGSAQRLRERDDAERWLSGSAHSSSALGSEQDPSPDLQAQVQAYMDLAQRKEAELRNYRNRVRQDMDDARKYAVEALLHDLFPALDALAQALASFDMVQRGDDPLLDGLRNTARALEGALLKHGVERIDAAGVAFDSEVHQPVAVEASDQVTEDKVVEVYSAGYRLGGKVLKPAMVKVLQPG